VAGYHFDYVTGPTLPTDFAVDPDGRAGTVHVDGKTVRFTREEDVGTGYAHRLVVLYKPAGVLEENHVYHLGPATGAGDRCGGAGVHESEGAPLGSGGEVAFLAAPADPAVAAGPFGHRELAGLFFEAPASVLSLLQNGPALLSSVYDILSSGLFGFIMDTLAKAAAAPPKDALVRATALIYTQCFAQELDIKHATKLDPIGASIRQNARAVFAAYPERAMLELGECARALCGPIVNGTAVSLTLTMARRCPAKTVRRPATCGKPGVATAELVRASGGGGARTGESLKRKVTDGAYDELAAELAVVPDVAAVKFGDGRTLLHVAVESKQHAIARLLLGNGVDVNAVDGKGRTALASAVALGDARLVTMLLQQPGIVPDTTADDNGLTPLHLSVRKDHGHMSIVLALLRGGAAPQAATAKGTTAHDVARRHGHEKAAALIAEWPETTVVAGGGGAGGAGGAAAAAAGVAWVPGTRVLRVASADGQSSHTSTATSGGGAANFGTWVRRLPDRSEASSANTVALTMAEKLALAASRLVKEQIRVLEGSVPAGCEVHPADSPARQVFLALSNDLWSFVAAEMEFVEAHLRAGEQHIQAARPTETPVAAPATHAAMADVYMAALLDTHNGGLLQTMPFVDMSAYGHTAILIDAYLHALPALHLGPSSSSTDSDDGGGGDSVGNGAGSGGAMGPLEVPGGRQSATSPFFLRTDSIEPFALGALIDQDDGGGSGGSGGGGGGGNDLVERAVDRSLPLASNPFLLMGKRSEKFGGGTEADGESVVHRHSRRLDEAALPAVVAGSGPAREWSGDGNELKTWDNTVDFEAAQALQSMFQRRWRTTVELMGSEFTHFFSDDEEKGFFAGCLTGLLSVESKLKIFKDWLKGLPIKAGCSSASFTVTREKVVETSASVGFGSLWFAVPNRSLVTALGSRSISAVPFFVCAVASLRALLPHCVLACPLLVLGCPFYVLATLCNCRRCRWPRARRCQAAMLACSSSSAA
jgi:hypothetical protein